MIHICVSKDPVVAAAKIPILCGLWLKWAEEEGHKDADAGYWARKLLRGVLDQNLVMLVVYDDEVPIGMACMDYGIEPGHGRVRIQVDKLYIVPARRGEKILDRIGVALEGAADDLGAYEHVVSCEVGSFLEDYYKGWGFEPTDLVMRRFVT